MSRDGDYTLLKDYLDYSHANQSLT